MIRFAVIFYLIIQIFCTTDKINERRILLPYNDGVPTNFTLETFGDENACYKWSSSRPDIASVKLLLDSITPADTSSCSKRALVTVVSRIPKRQSTVVTAHDLKTNLQIRCDVEVDAISRITIQTTTKEIVYGELPETIRVFAYSEKNDMFTSIGGVSFDWCLTPSDVIRYRPWSTSSYASPDFVEYWESRGKKSSMILVEGVKTGSAKIRATLSDNESMIKMEPAEINIHVVANLLLLPSNDIFMVPGAIIHFSAEISKQGPRVSLQFPNEQYYLEVYDSNIASFDESTNVLTALNEGHTTLVLKDRNMISNGSSPEDVLYSRTRTDIHIMPPSYISMLIEPGDRFQLVTDFEYQLHLSLYDNSHNLLHPSDNFHFELKMENDQFFEILENSLNKTFYRIRTRQKIGTANLLVFFRGAGNFFLSEPLIHQQDVTIHPPITLTPKEIYLPWLPSNDSSQPKVYTVNVEALGATSSGYNWQSSNETLAILKFSTHKSTRATIHRKGVLGDVWIICNDIHNSLIFNSKMLIQVLPIDALEILPSIVEAPIGGEVLLPIAVLAIKDGKKFYFDDCSQVKFDVDIVEKNRIRYNADTFMPGTGRNSCRSLLFECIASGNSRVTISYNHLGLEDRKISTHTIIGCYKPLKMIHPIKDQIAILSLGAGIDLAFEGGPRPWSMYPEGHFTKAIAINSSIIELMEIRDRYRFNKDLHIFRAYCNQYGETEIEFKVGNIVSPTLLNPASTITLVRIKCSLPETLIIKPKTKSSCPHQDVQFSLEKNRSHELEVHVLDRQGNAFYNFSTLYFEWSKDLSNGIFEEANRVLEEVNGARGFSILTRSYQVFSGLTNSIKAIRVGCRIIGYHQHRRFPDQFDIRREIELIILDPLTVTEESITVLKHSDYKKVLNIVKGSGHFSLDWQEKQNVLVELAKDDKREFIVTPLQTGNGMIIITDLCLNYPPFMLPYSVVEAIDIKIQMADKIELGHSIQGTFFVLDNRGKRLHSSLHKFLDLIITSSNNLLKIEDVKPKDDYLSTFAVRAERLGLCKLLIETQSPKIRSILSAQIELQIFSPLRITPTNITLIVGNVFQPQFIGGPQTQRNVEFELEDSSIAITTPIVNGPNGLIKALKNGKTRLIARVTSIDNYEYSRAQAEIYVTPLKKIQIWTPINQVFVGASIPVYLIGSSGENETPFMFGHARPSIKISWSLSNDKIGTLENSFQKVGIYDRQVSDEIAVRFSAHSIGTVMLKVVVEVTSASRDPLFEQLYRNQPLTNSIQIQVYPNYVLSVSSPMDSFTNIRDHPKQLTGRALLMSPQSELLLHQNSMDDVRYRIWNESSHIKLTNKTGNLMLQAGDQLEFSSLVIERDLYRTGIMDHFNQIIHVDKVRYLSIELDPVQYPEHMSTPLINLASFPIGSEISMVIHFHNQLGRRFDSVKSNLKWMMSRNDIITVIESPDESTQSFRIRSLKPGSVILKIWDDINQVGQYYKIVVDWAITSINEVPTDDSSITLQVGDVVCMRTKIEDHQQQQGFWHLDQQDSLIPIGWINPKVGALLALSPGKGSIVFNHSLTRVSTYKPFQVLAIKRVILNTDVINGLSTTSKHIVPINVPGLSSKQTNSCPGLDAKAFADVEHLVPFACDVSFSDGISDSLWNAKVQYNPQQNGWSCILTPKKNLDLDSLALWKNRNVTVTIVITTLADTIISSDHSNEQQQFFNSFGLFHQVQFPFWPEFRTNLKQILLTSESREVRFIVHSVIDVLEEMVIKSSNEDIISIQKQMIYEHDQSFSNSMRVIVSLRNIDIFSNDVSNLHIILQSLLVNQTEKIPIQLKLFDRSLFGVTNLPGQLLIGSNTALESFYTISLLIITIILAFSIYVIGKKFVLDRQQQIIYVDSSSPILQTSPKRVIDYNRTPTTSGQSFSMFGTQQTPFAAIHSTPGNMSSNEQNRSRSSSPSSPRVGRPLYSTRSIIT
ncbi:nuclear pore membrane glycoprotein 210-like protein [Dermatophagoides farinae]|uniref:Nuclear pore membrane glycoprotein 210-like protein n=1 Tax=Dermatophagoides farinae TaxID=6954 RepID=A0A9D4P8G4_DERFA|nr:nuclear pore membrane glycoprotein 210-like protein [Dermatophagoides farinae]